jgi:membrane associated rhomboid family serine protease
MASPAPLQHIGSSAWRDALVRKLVERPAGQEPVAYLSDIGAEDAAFILPDSGLPLYVMTWPPEAPPGEVLERLQHVIENGPPSGHVLLVGGGAPARQLCEEQIAFHQLRRKAVFHHLAEDGTIWNSATRLRPLDSAVEEIRDEVEQGKPLAPLSLGEIVAAREAFRHLASAEQAAATAIRSRRMPGTIGLLAAVLILFGLEVLWGGSTSPEVLYRMGAAYQRALLAGEWWRLISPAFLHNGLLHIAVNAWSLWAIGVMLERLFGTARFLVLYTVGVIAAAAASSFFSAGLSVGASGAIFALMGGLFAVTWRPHGLLPPTMVRRLRRGMWPTLLMNVGISLVPSVDWRAHLGGMVAGVALVGSGLLVRGLPPTDGRATAVPRSIGWMIAACLCVGLLAAGVVAALVHGQPWVPETP